MKKANYYSCRGAYRRLLRLLRSIYATNSILPPPREKVIKRHTDRHAQRVKPVDIRTTNSILPPPHEQVIKRYVDRHAQRVKFANIRKKYLRHEQHK